MSRNLDRFSEECGVMGIFGVPQAAYLAYQGLYQLQHRGQESAGVATDFNNQIYIHKKMGLVSEVFSGFDFGELPGDIAIGHNRYSTTGSSHLSNAQPLFMESRFGMLALAHNGNIINARALRETLQNEGSIFQTSSDSEVMVHLLTKSKEKEFVEAMKQALSQVTGAFSITALLPGTLIAARDPLGFRPLCLGKLGEGWAIASETCAFDMIGAEYVRDIEPGEILLISKEKGLVSHYLPLPKEGKKQARCIFEFIYFSRPDSMIFNSNCDKVRREMGRQLAREDTLRTGDIVISVPDSSNTAALGYSEETGIPFELGLIRNHYVGRTFIKPTQDARAFSVKLKFNPVKGVLRGKRIILVEDSIVRGTTLKELIKLIKACGTKEIHIRVASPPIIAPCFFGIDLSTKKEIIASNKTVQEICDYVGADSLRYLSLEGMLKVAPDSSENYCVGCFTENYPVPTHFIADRLKAEAGQTEMGCGG
jgi:amidophosphoribosyltransferase